MGNMNSNYLGAYSSYREALPGMLGQLNKAFAKNNHNSIKKCDAIMRQITYVENWVEKIIGE